MTSSLKLITTLIFKLLILCFFACKSEKKGYSYNLKNSDTSYVMLLDALTPPDTYMIQYIGNYNTSNSTNYYLALLNKSQNAIYFFDNKGKEVSRIKLPVLEETKLDIDGFCFVNSDSVLLYDRSNKSLFKFSLKISSRLHLLKKFSEKESPTTYRLPELYVNVRHPIYLSSGALFMTGRVFLADPIEKLQSKKIACGVELDIASDSNRFFSFYENVFTQRYWHNEQYFVKQAYNNLENILVFSLPMKDTIVVFNLNEISGIPKYYYAGSDEIRSEDSFIPKDKISWKDIGSFKDLEAFMKLPRYDNIVYDNYRRIYYRMLSKGNMEDRMTSVILLDEDFNKIGESTLPKGYSSTSGYFITKEGLYIRKYLKDEENKIVFTLFKFSKI